MQALVEHKGKQFLVEENSEFKFPYLGGEVGEKIELSNSKLLNKKIGSLNFNLIPACSSISVSLLSSSISSQFCH